jgi:hypothetical protein
MWRCAAVRGAAVLLSAWCALTLSACGPKPSPAPPAEIAATALNAQDLAHPEATPVEEPKFDPKYDSKFDSGQADSPKATPGGPAPAKPRCTPEGAGCIALLSDCPADKAGCVVAQLDIDFPAGFFARAPVLDGLSLAERHPRWRGARDETQGAEIAWRKWSEGGSQQGPIWVSVTVAAELALGGGKPRERPVAFVTDVAFHPLAPTFGWSRVALLGWSKARRPIVLTDKGPAEIYSDDIRIGGLDAYLVIDKARGATIARLAAPRILREGRFAFLDRKRIYYLSKEGGAARCLKSFGPARGMIEAGPAGCGGLAEGPDEGDEGLAAADASDVAAVRKAAPVLTAQADQVGCGADAAGRVYRIADDPGILVYAAQIICD